MGFYQEEAARKILSQLSESPNFCQIIDLLGKDADGIDKMLEKIGTLDVYNARGVWLDLIGVIVGRSRKVDVPLELTYFGFIDQPNTTSFSRSRMRDHSDGKQAITTTLPDEEYRKVILAQVAKNYGDVSKFGIVSALQNLMGTEDVLVYNKGNAKISIFIGKRLEDNFKELIRKLAIIPIAAGVDVEFIMAGDRGEIFGFRQQGFAGFGRGRFIRRISVDE